MGQKKYGKIPSPSVGILVIAVMLGTTLIGSAITNQRTEQGTQSMVASAARSPRIKASDREIGVAVLTAMAESDKPYGRFSPRGMYDDDSDTVERITELLGEKVPKGVSWSYLHRRLMRVCNHLANYGVISGQVFANPDRQYIGEEVRQKEFFWGNVAYAFRICPEKYPHYTPRPGSTPEREIDWLLRHAYPVDDE